MSNCMPIVILDSPALTNSHGRRLDWKIAVLFTSYGEILRADRRLLNTAKMLAWLFIAGSNIAFEARWAAFLI
jgi:hypothetical protein